MCGIAGLFGEQPNLGVLQAMLLAMRHRGPDDSGIWYGSSLHVALANTRLAIQDLSSTGHMPMTDGQRWITYNGEVYNFLSLRKELERSGHAFRSSSDTEVILAAYRQWGTDCVKHFRGMFAFAIYDPRDGGQLFLARDHFGIKPLYYAQVGGLLLFASEIRAFLASRCVPQRLNRQAVWDYLSVGSVIPPNTILENVYALLPGHALTVNNGGVNIWRWWDLAEASEQVVVPHTLEEAASEVRRLLEESVRLQMIADVPVGAFLSGGIDSTTIVGLMSACADQPVHTYSVAFQTASAHFSELPYADIASQQFNTVHEEIIVPDREIEDQFDTMIGALDQPSVDGINSYLVSKAARRGVTVSLSGLGGDELFAGYPHFGRFLKANQWLPHGSPSIHWSTKYVEDFLPARWMLPLAFMASPQLERHITIRQQFADREKRALLNPEWADTIDPNSLRTFYSRLLHVDCDPVSQISYVEIRGYMAHTLLRDIDAMSMAHSLEVRVPFLDHVLAEFVFALPGHWKWHHGQGKRVLRHAVGDLMPERILARRKMGFDLPLQAWMSGVLQPVISETLHSPVANALLRPGVLNDLTHRCKAYRIWPILVLLRWLHLTRVEL